MLVTKFPPISPSYTGSGYPRGCPLDGSQSGVKKLDLGVAFSDGGDSRLPELSEKRDVRAPVADPPPQYSLASLMDIWKEVKC